MYVGIIELFIINNVTLYICLIVVKRREDRPTIFKKSIIIVPI